ncbi:hypothetical protein M8818_006817 [Zalaria obscura]|uniref:Uncharacterized protein n=1 Tax=Zalaria obscura TaxID=2024903 RepID=A0ACC3S5Y2_9PEZI
MSDVPHTTAPTTEPTVAAPATTEPVASKTEETVATAEPTSTTAAVETTPVEATKTEEPIAAETAVTEPATTEATAATETPKAIEPITSGKLGYKGPGLLKSFKFSSRHFWFGEEAVSTQHLSNYLRGEKPEVAHPTAAWSSQTGKGLLYFVKHADDKAHPQGVLNLAEATDLEKQSPHEFSFKVHGHKHTFKATNDVERDGWYIALENAIPEAKSAKEGILSSEGYKESVAHLGKPAALAGGVAAGSKTTESAPKKSTDLPKAERVASSSSSSSSDSEAKKNKKNKSRSVSRGKRASIFGSMLGKKEEHDTKKEIKKEEKAEAKEEKEAEVAGAPVLDAHAIAERVVGAEVETTPATTTEPVAATETAPTTETAAVAEAPKTTTATPKPTKRNSIFGSIYNKVRSPTTEKKEFEVGPSVPPKDTTAVSAEPPVLPETATTEATEAPVTVTEPATQPEVVEPVAEPVVASEAVTEAPKTTTATTPGKEKTGFFGKFMSQARAKSPAAEKRSAPVAASTAAPAVPPKDETVVSPATEEPLAVAATEPAATETAATETTAPAATTESAPSKVASPKESRRKSYFGSLGAKKTEGETTEEKSSSKFGSIFRKPSQAYRSKSQEPKKDLVAPTEKTEEEAVVDETEAPAAHVGTDGPIGEAKAVEPTSEATPVGPASTPTVSATA